MIHIAPHTTITFLGDSITDAQHTYDVDAQLGVGYVQMIMAHLGMAHPGAGLTGLNTGLSGDRVDQIAKRWTAAPIPGAGLVSIMAGINDVWQDWDGTRPLVLPDVAASYRELLTSLSATAPRAQLLLITPFVLATDPAKSSWPAQVLALGEIIKQLGHEFDASVIDAQELFARKCDQAPPAAWSFDGVHLTPGGHLALATEWLQHVQLTGNPTTP